MGQQRQLAMEVVAVDSVAASDLYILGLYINGVTTRYTMSMGRRCSNEERVGIDSGTLQRGQAKGKT